MGYNAEFYSGADLSALLAEAQLAAVHEALEASTASTSRSDQAATEGVGAAPSEQESPDEQQLASEQQPQQPQPQQKPPAAALSPVIIEGRHLEAALLAVRGVVGASVSLTLEQGEVQYSEAACSPAALVAAVEGAGFEAAGGLGVACGQLDSSGGFVCSQADCLRSWHAPAAVCIQAFGHA